MARTPVAGALWLVVSRDERRRPCRPPRSTHRRLDSSPRNLPGAKLSIDDGGVSLSPPGGPTLVPLGDVATLEFKPGPAEIARDAQSRRTSVEFNVRDADLLTVANAAKASVDASLKLPVGYRPEWGGQFQHHTEAKQRLAVVVPLALGLIAFLLWLAFRDARAAGLIFLGVPFAVVGGVLALSARGIPFSISAGVGFVALFGVAVLNGLVLVSFARDLERRGRSHDDAIREATEARLRPVLMTALVASLGFVPMALSTYPGAEVQRPLATVVIGGLLSATVLTLFVLPVLYTWTWARGAQPVAPSDH